MYKIKKDQELASFMAIPNWVVLLCMSSWVIAIVLIFISGISFWWSVILFVFGFLIMLITEATMKKLKK